MTQAIDLAIRQRGGKAGAWQVEHVSLDDSTADGADWSREIEEANAKYAASDRSVVAYVGPYTSGATAVALPVTNREGLLELGPSATWPGLTLGGWDPGEPDKYYPSGTRTFARLMPPDSVQGDAAALAAHDDSVASVFVVSDGSSYSDGLARSFGARASSLGVRLVGELTVSGPWQADTTARISESRAEAVYYAASTVGQALRAAAALQPLHLAHGVYTTDTAFSDQFLEGAGRAAESWSVTYNGITDMPETAQWDRFAGDFRAVYGQDPDQFAGNTYDLTNLALDAIAGAGRDRQSVLTQVLRTRGYQGATGEVSLDANGDRVGWTVSRYSVSGGHYVFKGLLSGP